MNQNKRLLELRLIIVAPNINLKTFLVNKHACIWKSIPVICYYGVSAHGKELVDVMSGFGAKGPLKKAVVTQDLHYYCASNIVSFLKDLFINDNQKHQFELESKEIQSLTISTIKRLQNTAHDRVFPWWLNSAKTKYLLL